MVRDLSGQPIVGATLNVGGYGFDLSERENLADSSVQSSVDGQWTCNQIPRDAQTVTVTVGHPDFAFLSTNLLLRANETPALMLEPGVGVSGVVTDSAGAPVEGVAVSDDDRFSERRHMFALSETGGRFFFPHVRPGKLRLLAKQAQDQGGCELDLTADTDVQLVIEPPPKTLAPLNPPALDQVLHLVGTVVADDTGQPLSRFKVLLGKRVIAGETWGISHTLDSPALFLGEGKAGGFDWVCPLPMASVLLEFTLEIRADGYLPQVSPATPAQTTPCTFAFRLKRDQLAAGQLATPDGNPAAGAIVLLAGTNSTPLIGISSNEPLGLQIHSAPGARATSGAEGQFALKPVAGVDRVFLLHDSGCRLVPLTECTGATIRLQPWGRVEGELYIGQGLGTNQRVGIQPAVLTRDAPCIPFSSRNVRTDSEGRFAFPRVPAGNYHVFRVFMRDGPGPRPFGFSHHVAVRVDPGQTTRVQIGGHGRQVIGSIHTVPAGVVTNWTVDLPRFIRRSESAMLPKLEDFPTAATFTEALSALQPSYYLAVSEDGTFIVDDVPPGIYELNITLSRPAELPGAPAGLRLPIGTFQQEITIPEPDPANPDEAVDLGAVTVEVRVP
jgi:hypothetical protein